MIQDQIQIIPAEIWDIIFTHSNFESIVRFSNASKTTNELTSKKIQTIYKNKLAFISLFKNIQNYYTVKYRNLDGPHVDINTIGKQILIKLKITETKVKLEVQIVQKEPKLESNQILVSPCFEPLKKAEYLVGNNQGLLWGGASFNAFSIVQDMLPIRKIVTESRITDLYLLIALREAETAMNKTLDSYRMTNFWTFLKTFGFF